MSKSKKNNVNTEVETKKSKSKKNTVEHDEQIRIEMEISDEVQQFHDSMIPQDSKSVDTENPFVKNQAPVTSSEGILDEDNIRDLLESELDTRKLDDKTYKFVRSAIRNNKTSKVKALNGMEYTKFKTMVGIMVDLLINSSFPVSKVTGAVDEILKFEKMDATNVFGETFESIVGEAADEEFIRATIIETIENHKLGGSINAGLANVMISVFNGDDSLLKELGDSYEKISKYFDGLLNSTIESMKGISTGAVESMISCSLKEYVEMASAVLNENGLGEVFEEKFANKSIWIKSQDDAIDQILQAVQEGLEPLEDVTKRFKTVTFENGQEMTVELTSLGTVALDYDYLEAKYCS